LSGVPGVVEGLAEIAGGLVEMSDRLWKLTKGLSQKDIHNLLEGIDDVGSLADDVDDAFQRSATAIMALESLPVNPDYFLEIAKQLDRMADLLERAALLTQTRPSMKDEISELLESAIGQSYQIAVDLLTCLRALEKNRAQVEKICEVIGERERAVDSIREHFDVVAACMPDSLELRLWMKDVLGNVDQMADHARDVSITMRAVALRLERQTKP
jgi:uncharacterized protein Yka (UPF0111/DUF47 family)